MSYALGTGTTSTVEVSFAALPDDKASQIYLDLCRRGQDGEDPETLHPRYDKGA